MDRVKEVSRIINNLEISSLLDVGCRDCILKTYLDVQFDYNGCDLYQNEKHSVKYVGDVVKLNFEKKFDAVVAIDIIEHVDDPYILTNKLFKLSNQYFIVSLPNIYDLKHKYMFLFKNTLGGKYRFRNKNSLDRHRWLMSYDEIINFYRFFAEKNGCDLQLINIQYGNNKLSINSVIGKFLRYIFPKSSTTAIVAVFKKK